MNIFSFRAETRVDVNALWELLKQKRLAFGSTIKQEEGYPDVEVEINMTTPMDVEELRLLCRQVVDGHVMLETLRPVPLKDNSLERDLGVYNRPELLEIKELPLRDNSTAMRAAIEKKKKELP